MKRGTLAAAVAVMAAMAAGSHARGGELVVNGGFETGSFFPWSAPGPIPNEQLFFVSGGGGHTGQRYAQLSSTQLRFMSQLLPTAAGQDYELSFWLRYPGPPPSLFVVRWEGTPVLNQLLVLPDSTNWHQFTIPMHSNITGSLLEFGQRDFPGVWHIDDISVVPVPVPSAGALLGVAGAIALGRRPRRRPLRGRLVGGQ